MFISLSSVVSPTALSLKIAHTGTLTLEIASGESNLKQNPCLSEVEVLSLASETGRQSKD